MAHFAQIGRNNRVINVVRVNNAFMGTPEKETNGETYLKESYGIFPEWVQCSYNTKAGVHALGGTPFRANYPAKGWYYDETNDIFHEARPTDKDGQSCASWTMNTTTGIWSAPLTQPTSPAETETSWYVWDESAYQANNATGWVKSDA